MFLPSKSWSSTNEGGRAKCNTFEKHKVGKKLTQQMEQKAIASILKNTRWELGFNENECSCPLNVGVQQMK
jgi:hypothetical protein